MTTHDRKRINRPALTGIIVFTSLMLLCQCLTYQRYLLLKGAEERQVSIQASYANERMQSIIRNIFSTTQVLKFIVEKYGIPNDYDSVANGLLMTNKYIDWVEVIEGGVIKKVYPLKGNESIIGYNILKDSVYNSGAFAALKKKDFFVSGPLNLIQGGVGIIGRSPVYRNNKFWGFTAAVIRLNTLMKAAGIDKTDHNFSYQLAKVNPYTKEEQFFLPGGKPFEQKYFVPMEMPEGEWKLYVVAENSIVFYGVVAYGVLGFLLSVIGGLFAWFIARQPAKLKKMVEEKTALLQSSEKKYRVTMERISDAVVALDKNWRYTFINSAGLATHPAGREATLGKIIWEVHPEMEGSIFQKKYQEAMETGKTLEVESYYQPMDTWFSVKVYPSPDGLTIFYNNVTERKKAEEEIKQLNTSLELKVAERTAALQNSIEELKTFSYSVSHDLRAPLRIINGNAQVIQEDYYDKLDDNGKKVLDTIVRQSVRMGQLIDDLLRFSHIGRAAINAIQVDMNVLVHKVIDEIKQGGELKAELKIAPLAPAHCDYQLLRQVWYNLISNAIKYSSKKENPVIEIGCLAGQNTATYFVKDNGAGFDMLYADKLFGVFQRLHRVQEFEGTGVGLAIAHRIITRHGGKIWAEAKENEGAIFYFTLQ